MTWICGDHGMKMTLSKDVPGLVAKNLRSFLSTVLEQAGTSLDSACAEARFAVHPGGPKILDQVKETLGLREEQIQASREVLREYGNMSSATLPHIWQRIAQDEHVPAGAPIISMAFGPGLTICAAVMSKVSA